MKERVFLDEARIYVKAGDGGNGIVAFRREKYVPRGGPSGGDGGDGGNVYLEASSHYSTLFHFKKYPHHKAQRGRHGAGNRKQGRKGDDITVLVPVGTLAREAGGTLLFDFTVHGQKVLVAKGGRGGKGNARFATAVQQAPRYAEEGTEGEEKTIDLELKLMAQVGLIGLPNAGKSTLLAVVSSAKPRIAAFPFTTLVPQMGVVEFSDGPSLTIAEIPGIIEGAHNGKGLGLQFLKHAERVSLLCHLVDASVENDVNENIRTLEKEIERYGTSLRETPRMMVATKLDVLQRREGGALKKIRDYAEKQNLPFAAVSAARREGISDFLRQVRERVQ